MDTSSQPDTALQNGCFDAFGVINAHSNDLHERSMMRASYKLTLSFSIRIQVY